MIKVGLSNGLAEFAGRFLLKRLAARGELFSRFDSQFVRSVLLLFPQCWKTLSCAVMFDVQNCPNPHDLATRTI